MVLLQVYTPIVFTQGCHAGTLDVQITDEKWHLLKDPRWDRFADNGAWEITDKWSAEQNGKFQSALNSLRSYSQVEETKHENGISKVLRIEI